MTVPEILHGARPIDAGHKAIKAQTGALQHLRRTDVERVFEGGLGTNLVEVPQQKNTGERRDHQACCGDHGGALPGVHRVPPALRRRVSCRDSRLRLSGRAKLDGRSTDANKSIPCRAAPGWTAEGGCPHMKPNDLNLPTLISGSCAQRSAPRRSTPSWCRTTHRACCSG